VYAFSSVAASSAVASPTRSSVPLLSSMTTTRSVRPGRLSPGSNNFHYGRFLSFYCGRLPH